MIFNKYKFVVFLAIQSFIKIHDKESVFRGIYDI